MAGRAERIKPYEGTDPYIFVSYSHRDYDRIEPILKGLIERGYRIWYDNGIDPGTEWPESIAGHLENSTVCLSFISSFSADSPNCRREIYFALSRDIAMVTVFLEQTELSPGLEMQISTYQTIMGYTYPDLSLLLDRIVSVDSMDPCRDTPDVSAPDGQCSQKKNGSQRRMIAPVLTVLVLILAAAVIVFALKNGSDREEKGEGISGSFPAVTLTPGPSDPEEPGPTETPQEKPAGYPMWMYNTKNNWKRTLWDDPPVTADDPLPEGYRVLVYGEWGYGSILVYVDGERSVRFSLTDDRIPTGFPISDIPGKNDPYWSVSLMLTARDKLGISIQGIDDPASFAVLETWATMFSGNSEELYGGVLYSMTGNTFVFGVELPEQFTTDDIHGIGVGLGTERLNYVDTYDFFP